MCDQGQAGFHRFTTDLKRVGNISKRWTIRALHIVAQQPCQSLKATLRPRRENKEMWFVSRAQNRVGKSPRLITRLEFLKYEMRIGAPCPKGADCRSSWTCSFRFIPIGLRW